MSREQEILKDKADPVLAFNNDGNIKLSRRSIDLHCDVTGETKLRNALTRRALAFDQAGCFLSHLWSCGTTPCSGHCRNSHLQVSDASTYNRYWQLTKSSSPSCCRIHAENLKLLQEVLHLLMRTLRST